VINHCTPLIDKSIICIIVLKLSVIINIIPSIKWPRVIGSNTLNEKRSLKLWKTQWKIYIDHLTEWYVYHSDLSQKICGCDHMMVAMPMVWIPLMVRCTLYNIMWSSLVFHNFKLLFSLRVLLPITLGHFILGMIFMITDSLSTIIQIILLSIRGVMCLSQWFITAYPWHEIKQEWYSGIIKTLSHNTRNIVSVIFCKLLSGFGKGSFHAQSHLNISRSYFLVGSFKAQNDAVFFIQLTWEM
jgi:hypothetical protein